VIIEGFVNQQMTLLVSLIELPNSNYTTINKHKTNGTINASTTKAIQKRY
jgi:hypothetical protein